MKTTTLTLGSGLAKTSFDVVHNLEELGHDIQKAFHWWRTNRRNLNVHMFCRYIRQKDNSFICLPADEVAKLRNN